MLEAGTGGVLCKKVFFKIWKIENLIARVWVEEILFDKLKWNTKKLKCFELQMICKTHQVHQHDQASHSIKASTNISLLLRNEVNNWK